MKGKITLPIAPRKKSENDRRNKETIIEDLQIRFNVSSLNNQSTRALYSKRLDQKTRQTEFVDVEQEYTSIIEEKPG